MMVIQIIDTPPFLAKWGVIPGRVFAAEFGENRCGGSGVWLLDKDGERLKGSGEGILILSHECKVWRFMGIHLQAKLPIRIRS